MHFSHHASIFSLLNSAKQCDFCHQFSAWLGRHKIEEYIEYENQGCRTQIDIVPRIYSSTNAFEQCSSWMFQVSVYRQLARKGVEIPLSLALEDCGSKIAFAITYDIDGDGRIIRPLWTYSEPVSIEQRLPTVTSWLKRCKDEHAACRSERLASLHDTLPARIIYIDPDRTTEYAVLVNPSAVRGRIKYLALSHCWGKSKPPICTKKQNLSAHQKEIPLCSLPKTFYDAVRITQLLGFRYLWIDSLCIIQDCPEDWQREAAKMASIYQSADIVLSAASASNSSEGFSTDTMLESAMNIPIFTPSSTALSRSESQGNETKHRRLFLRRESNSAIEFELQDCPIQSRGWIFQEILLAQRIVYFVNGHMIWQCHHSLESEDGLFALTPSQFLPNSITDQGSISSTPLYDIESCSTSSHRVQSWWDILSGFFSRDFTKSTDSLPSLAGLIQFWQSASGDVPIVGLWKQDLVLHLCWYLPHASGPRVPQQPTWCWTSIELIARPDIQHISSDIDFDPADIIWKAAITDIDIEWEGLPFVSCLKHARLSVSRTQVSGWDIDDVMERDCESRAIITCGTGAESIVPLFVRRREGVVYLHGLLVKRVEIGGEEWSIVGGIIFVVSG
ncbi:heterokaryon incompatibility protein-domain-containing protein [Dendryphion nanum]|uniref:Heterokaryon incompatibility protein-domain-containing protein n=1 Tax=Dendryphion nanum TaxID=256645 RepID=A0A9P9CZJ2_9PLEO|nr:heterokaryon incompatibility protein-domain-containing protein [Dendryphion nanum]